MIFFANRIHNWWLVLLPLAIHICTYTFATQHISRSLSRCAYKMIVLNIPSMSYFAIYGTKPKKIIQPRQRNRNFERKSANKCKENRFILRSRSRWIQCQNFFPQQNNMDQFCSSFHLSVFWITNNMKCVTIFWYLVLIHWNRNECKN